MFSEAQTSTIDSMSSIERHEPVGFPGLMATSYVDSKKT